MTIPPEERRWLEESGLVDEDVDLAAVRIAVGGPVGWYLGLVGRSALTLGTRIWFRDEARRGRRPLLVHELVHVAQYRDRGMLRFLGGYLRDLARARFRYHRGLPLERPAYERQRRARALLESQPPPAP